MHEQMAPHDGIRMMESDPVESLLQALPQTQCGRCGFGGCLPYAQAIHSQAAPLDRCPPGGQYTLERLAALTGRAKPQQVDPTLAEGFVENQVAFIEEEACIGCTKCLDPCPVDAIVGAAKMLHTVWAEQCTGCGLCVPVCPVDCIRLEPVAQTTAPDHAPWPLPLGDGSRQRYEAKQQRQASQKKAERAAWDAQDPEALLRRYGLASDPTSNESGTP